MKLTHKILSISFIPLICLIIGSFICGYIVYKGDESTKNYLKNYANRQEKIGQITTLIGFGHGIHDFKNYVLRGDQYFYNSAKKNFKKAAKLIDDYLAYDSIENIEKSSLNTIKNNIFEYLEKIENAKQMKLKNRSQELIDKAVKVDDAPALLSLNSINNFLKNKKLKELDNINSSQKRALSITIIVFLFAIFTSIFLSTTISTKLIKSITAIFKITREISKGNLTSKTASTLKKFPNDELKELAKQMFSMRKSLHLSFSELKKSNEELSQFAFVASHDLQEPVKKVITYSELLEMELKNDLNNNGKIFLEEIKKSSVRMINLIQALLEYSKLQDKHIEKKEVSLNLIIENVTNSLSEVIKKNNAKILYSNLPSVFGNQELLESLFQNLISNALKFQKNDSTPLIEIIAKMTDENFIQIEFKDNGIGFNIEHSDKIFKPFARLHLQKEYSGVGIGLPLCKKIVEYQHGKIWAKSIQGEGSQFFFTLEVKNHDNEGDSVDN